MIYFEHKLFAELAQYFIFILLNIDHNVKLQLLNALFFKLCLLLPLLHIYNSKM